MHVFAIILEIVVLDKYGMLKIVLVKNVLHQPMDVLVVKNGIQLNVYAKLV